MATYTFYVCKADGVSLSFVTFDLDSDEAARTQAALVLEDHASCAYVETWAGERCVLTLHRRSGAAAPQESGARAEGV